MHKKIALFALALATLLAACTTGAGASPSPTTPPAPTPSPSPSPAPTFGLNEIEHPTGKTDVILRHEQGGGLLVFGYFITQAPSFTLYGDGTVIYKQIDTRRHGPMGDGTELPWLVGHMDEASVQALLQYALSTGRLAGAREQYDDFGCADCGTTFFTINAAGIAKTVNVYGFFDASQPGPDQADRQGFDQLATLLNDFGAQTEVDLGDVVPYDPSHYKVVSLTAFGDPLAPPLAWPWDDVDWADWMPDPESNSREGVMDRAHVAELAEVPNGGHIGIWVTTPDDTNVQFGFRPLLPEEIDQFLNGGS